MMLLLETCGVERTRLGWPFCTTVIVWPMDRREKPWSQLGVAINVGVGVGMGAAWLHETISATRIPIDHKREEQDFGGLHRFLNQPFPSGKK